MLVSWPGKIKPDSESARTIGAEDCLPTILELLGIGKKVPGAVDGVSFAPTLLGKKQSARSFLYREFSGYGGQQAVWTGKWKGIRQKILRKKKNQLEIELYDLDADISETTNLAEKHPEIVAKLSKLMAEQHTPSELFPIAPLDKLAK